jgi:flagellar assembly factor FliW
MEVLTKAYGNIEVDERQIIQFPIGLFGFEQFHKYVLLDASQQPFYWLQSMDVQEIAFVLIDPFLFRPDYSIDIPDEELAEIGITKTDEILVFSIVTIPENQNLMTANLQGPIIINRTERVGRQFISSNTKWQVKHLILEELSMAGGSTC